MEVASKKQGTSATGHDGVAGAVALSSVVQAKASRPASAAHDGKNNFRIRELM